MTLIKQALVPPITGLKAREGVPVKPALTPGARTSGVKVQEDRAAGCSPGGFTSNFRSMMRVDTPSGGDDH